MPENTREQLRYAYKMWNETKGKSQELWLSLLSENVEFHGMGNGQPALSFAEDRKSRQEMVDYFSMLLNDWDMIDWNVDSVVQEKNLVAVFGRTSWTNKATGKLLETRVAHLWEFEGDQAVKVTEIFDSARAMLAATPDL